MHPHRAAASRMSSGPWDYNGKSIRVCNAERQAGEPPPPLAGLNWLLEPRGQLLGSSADCPWQRSEELSKHLTPNNRTTDDKWSLHWGCAALCYMNTSVRPQEAADRRIIETICFSCWWTYFIIYLFLWEKMFWPLGFSKYMLVSTFTAVTGKKVELPPSSRAAVYILSVQT